jgi:hypothetical protein
MPITYEIDRSRRIVFIKAVGILTPDMFAYQREAWSTPELTMMNALICPP